MTKDTKKDRIISTAFNFKSSTYEISNICNLSCEGCLYFSSYKDTKAKTSNDDKLWETFFKKEEERGIDYVYLAGAEPSLVPKKIEIAYRYIKRGVIVTNGLKPIDKKINYKIHISLWGDNINSSNYRGQKNNILALSNYKNDERALAVMTINSKNISEIKNVVLMCQEYKVPLTFNYFSPTEKYLNEEDKSLMLSSNDLIKAHSEIGKVIDNSIVIYDLDYNKWLIQKDGIYNLDKNGIATNCGNRLNKSYNLFNINREIDTGKCCVPNIVCEHCRTYVTSLSTYLYREHSNFEEWLKVLKLWKKIFL